MVTFPYWTIYIVDRVESKLTTYTHKWVPPSLGYMTQPISWWETGYDPGLVIWQWHALPTEPLCLTSWVGRVWNVFIIRGGCDERYSVFLSKSVTTPCSPNPVLYYTLNSSICSSSSITTTTISLEPIVCLLYSIFKNKFVSIFIEVIKDCQSL